MRLCARRRVSSAENLGGTLINSCVAIAPLQAMAMLRLWALFFTPKRYSKHCGAIAEYLVENHFIDATYFYYFTDALMSLLQN
jgi:hypothetical protein